MARHDAAELAHRLARDAEAVCRRYLSAGRREGGYWLRGRRAQYAGPLDVRSPQGVAERAGRQMDRRRDRRAW